MGAVRTENEALWPPFHGPSDLAEVELIPLSEAELGQIKATIVSPLYRRAIEARGVQQFVRQEVQPATAAAASRSAGRASRRRATREGCGSNARRRQRKWPSRP